MIIERKLKKSKCQRVQNSDEIHFTINFVLCVCLIIFTCVYRWRLYNTTTGPLKMIKPHFIYYKNVHFIYYKNVQYFENIQD